MKVRIEWQDQHGYWRPYQTQHHQQNAYRTATTRARSTGKRHRLVDEDGHLLDLIDP
jgi:hypothetical protein